jgi:hypothetical protein
MPLVEIREHALDPSAIARPTRNPLRKGAAIAVSARRTRFEQHAMFGHLQRQRGQVKDLPSLWGKLTDHVRQRCPTGHALRRRMDAPLIRDGHLVQRRAGMAQLAAGLSA